ncbi:MAG: type II secretion system secretin GspD [Methylococcaceae bacterium]
MNNLKKITTASCFIVVGLTLSSCELLGPKQARLLPLTPVPKQQPEKSSVLYPELQNKAPKAGAAELQSEIFPGTDRFVSNSVTPQRRTDSGGAGSYSLNFDEADLGEVAKVILSDILGQNYVLSPKVAGKVTLQTTQALTKEELLPTLEMVLRMNNAALVKDGRIYHIEPASEALLTSGISSTNRPGYQTRVIPVKNVAVQDIVEVIKPLVSEKTILHVDGARNILVTSGTADEIARVIDMVSTFDIDVLRGRSFGLFPLAHVEPETIIEELQSVFDKKSKDDDTEFFRFIAIDRLNAVMAITHQARYLNDIENWVRRLDRANSATGGGVNVYRAQNADAEELADTLNEIFAGAQKKDKSAKVAPGQKTTEITNKQSSDTQSTKTKKTSSSSGSRAATGDVQVSNVENVRIIADKANNSIVIVATPREYEVILPVIKQLDALPLQVLIDATIVSVTLKNELQYGISWYLSNRNDSLGGNKSDATLLGTAAAAAAAASTGGLSAVYSSGSVKALLSAQSDLNNVKVISSPSLMVLNNQQAKINVGDQVPLQTSTTSVPIAGGTDGATLAQSASIQYQDTGVTLEVTPRVNANGMVIMEISQIVSSVVPQTVGGDTTTGVTTTATIAKKEIESYVAVQDGETIVLGGLIADDVSNNKNGIPFLHELPWVGSLFGSTERQNNRTELVVLITPRVVKNKQESRLISDEFKRKLTGIYDTRPVSVYRP